MSVTREDEVALNRAKYGGRTARRQAPASPAPPAIPRITRLMALAVKFQDMVDRGEVRDFADLARLGFVTRARLTQIMNLTLLAPDIQGEILEIETDSQSRTAPTEQVLRSVSKIPNWRGQLQRLAEIAPPFNGS